jgi:predicted anti-sigma-YlaC factor YlaD
MIPRDDQGEDTLHINLPTHHKRALQLICKALEEDLDTPVCTELVVHFKTCPTCRIYFNSVRKTVKMYRTVQSVQAVPQDVSLRLFKVLNLE